MMLKLQPHTYKLQCQKGTEIGLVDCLSHLLQPYINDPDGVEEDLMVSRVDTVTTIYHNRLAEATNQDGKLKLVERIIMEGWPEHRRSIEPDIAAHWGHRDELCTYEDVAYRGERGCIPQSLRSEILKTLHISHLRIVKLKHRAREIVLWPGMNANFKLCTIANQTVSSGEPSYMFFMLSVHLVFTCCLFPGLKLIIGLVLFQLLSLLVGIHYLNVLRHQIA